MHTLKVIAGGFALLGVFLFVGRYLAGSRPGAVATAAKSFIPVWFVGSAINLWAGVSQAGYSVRHEAPIFLLNFGVPAAVAGLIWWLS
jgi:hypothetical protein